MVLGERELSVGGSYAIYLRRASRASCLHMYAYAMSPKREQMKRYHTWIMHLTLRLTGIDRASVGNANNGGYVQDIVY